MLGHVLLVGLGNLIQGNYGFKLLEAADNSRADHTTSIEILNLHTSRQLVLIYL